jgi:hypothetical protein
MSASDIRGCRKPRISRCSCGLRADVPDGQITCPAPFAKTFPFSLVANHFISLVVSSHRGAIAIVTNAGRDAVDARVRLTMRAFRGRRSRVVLTPRRWRQMSGKHAADDGDNKARSPGRARRKPLKPLRAGMPGETGEPTVTTLVWFYFFPREAAGASSTRHSPRPLLRADLSSITRA